MYPAFFAAGGLMFLFTFRTANVLQIALRVGTVNVAVFGGPAVGTAGNDRVFFGMVCLYGNAFIKYIAFSVK